MTVSERRNAATFIKHTTVRPFTFMGHSFKCFYCVEYFSDMSQLMEHTEQHLIHDYNVILAKYIPKGKRTLQVDISNLKCRLCDEINVNLNESRLHLEKEHGVAFCNSTNGMTEYKMTLHNGLYECHLCFEKFHNFNLLNSHMNCHYGKVICENCGAGFLNKHLLMKHREKHLINKLKCKNCDKVFVKKSQLKYHTEIIHKGKQRVKMKKCPHCSENFKEYHSKVKHLKEIHGISKTFACHICTNSFNTRRALTEHVNRFHTEKFKCGTCSKCFSIESKLKEHLRSHSSERNFICPVCTNSYMHKMTLKKHMKTHNSVFKFLCFECGSGFHGKNEFMKHMKQFHSNFEAGK